MIRLTLLSLFLSVSALSFGQKYVTKNGHIKFYSSTPMEDIEAHNKQVNSAFDASNGNMVFKVLIKSFQFEKALMQEHFNENYMESDKIPNATFSGKVENLGDLNLKKNGEYDVKLSGTLTIHGVSKEVSENGKFIVSDKGIQGLATIMVKPEDYEIKIPNAVADNIADEIEVSVDVKLSKLN